MATESQIGKLKSQLSKVKPYEQYIEETDAEVLNLFSNITEELRAGYFLLSTSLMNLENLYNYPRNLANEIIKKITKLLDLYNRITQWRIGLNQTSTDIQNMSNEYVNFLNTQWEAIDTINQSYEIKTDSSNLDDELRAKVNQLNNMISEVYETRKEQKIFTAEDVFSKQGKTYKSESRMAFWSMYAWLLVIVLLFGLASFYSFDIFNKLSNTESNNGNLNFVGVDTLYVGFDSSMSVNLHEIKAYRIPEENVSNNYIEYIKLFGIKLFYISLFYVALSFALKNYSTDKHNLILARKKMRAVDFFLYTYSSADEKLKEEMMSKFTDMLFREQDTGVFHKDTTQSPIQQFVDVAANKANKVTD